MCALVRPTHGRSENLALPRVFPQIEKNYILGISTKNVIKVFFLKIHKKFKSSQYWKNKIRDMLKGPLTIQYEKKIEQNINFIAEFFTMKGFHSDTYKISLIRPNRKKNIFCNMDFSCDIRVQISFHRSYFEIMG